MDNEVLEFIKRRFADNCHWKDGNCYWFAHILCERFKYMTLCYCPVEGHFVAKDGETLYDWEGIYNTNEPCISLKEIMQNDPLLYRRLVRDCIY